MRLISTTATMKCKGNSLLLVDPTTKKYSGGTCSCMMRSKEAAPLVGTGTFQLGSQAVGIEYLLVPIIGIGCVNQSPSVVSRIRRYQTAVIQ